MTLSAGWQITDYALLDEGLAACTEDHFLQSTDTTSI